MPTPVKPFASYRWRWLSANPSEGLLKPPVFLGVLRALRRNEGERFSSEELRDELAIVQAATGTDVDLVRTTERNLIRNMGQVWRGTGMLTRDAGEIRLTPLGRRVADGALTRDEFAALMVQQTVLPNPLTYDEDEIREWADAGLVIHPLRLIMQVVAEVRAQGGPGQGWIDKNELVKIVVPLAGARAAPEDIAKSLLRHRRGKLNISKWPNCAPGPNDKRMASEFLAFLGHFGLLRAARLGSNITYWLDAGITVEEVGLPAPEALETEADAEAAVATVRGTSMAADVERQRAMRMTLLRPGQARFRRNVLAETGRCLLSGETLPAVLEAAHIKPVEEDGADELGNGLCLRVDLHRLYDAGDIKLHPDGRVTLSERLAGAPTYDFLPDEIDLPEHVDHAHLEWRIAYY